MGGLVAAFVGEGVTTLRLGVCGLFSLSYLGVSSDSGETTSLSGSFFFSTASVGIISSVGGGVVGVFSSSSSSSASLSRVLPLNELPLLPPSLLTELLTEEKML